MSAANCGFHGPNLTHFPRFSTNKFKPQTLSLKPVCPSSNPFSPQFVVSGVGFLTGRRGGGRPFGLYRTMDAAGEGDCGGEVERDSVLEQEEESPFVAGSPASPALRTGLESTLNRLSKWLVAVLFAAVVLVRHDGEALWAAMGSVLNSALSVVLKTVLNQERPSSARSSGPGMPSSHAQSIFYSVIFLIWSLIRWLALSPFSFILGALVFLFGSYLSWLRVSQRYHTIRQVAVGAAVGSAFALAWLWWWDSLVLEAFVSFLWVRVVVLLGAVICCLGFLVYIVRHWLRGE